MQITHLGHACLLVEVADQRILVDPGAFSDVSAQRGLTAILVTHQHPDHRDPQVWDELLAASPEAEVWAEPQTAEQAGGRAQPLASGQQLSLGERGVSVTGVGEQHAVIHPSIERIGNRGLVLTADGEPTLFHPGDALDADPGRPVDVLAVPVHAPWAKLSETVDFVRRVAPGRAVPIHDGLLNDTGRSLYLSQLGALGEVQVSDLRGRGATQL